MKRPNIYQFVGQSDVSASQHTVYVSHSFPAKKQTSSDFVAADAIHSGFRGSDEEICQCFHVFSFYLSWRMGLDPMILVFLILNFKLAKCVQMLIGNILFGSVIDC